MTKYSINDIGPLPWQSRVYRCTVCGNDYLDTGDDPCSVCGGDCRSVPEWELRREREEARGEWLADQKEDRR